MVKKLLLSIHMVTHRVSRCPELDLLIVLHTVPPFSLRMGDDNNETVLTVVLSDCSDCIVLSQLVVECERYKHV